MGHEIVYKEVNKSLVNMFCFLSCIFVYFILSYHVVTVILDSFPLCIYTFIY